MLSSTDWATFESLGDFLEPADPSKTIEGHPAPYADLVVERLSLRVLAPLSSFVIRPNRQVQKNSLLPHLDVRLSRVVADVPCEAKPIFSVFGRIQLYGRPPAQLRGCSAEPIYPEDNREPTAQEYLQRQCGISGETPAVVYSA